MLNCKYKLVFNFIMSEILANMDKFLNVGAVYATNPLCSFKDYFMEHKGYFFGLLYSSLGFHNKHYLKNMIIQESITYNTVACNTSFYIYCDNLNRKYAPVYFNFRIKADSVEVLDTFTYRSRGKQHVIGVITEKELKKKYMLSVKDIREFYTELSKYGCIRGGRYGINEWM